MTNVTLASIKGDLQVRMAIKQLVVNTLTEKDILQYIAVLQDNMIDLKVRVRDLEDKLKGVTDGR